MAKHKFVATVVITASSPEGARRWVTKTAVKQYIEARLIAGPQMIASDVDVDKVTVRTVDVD